MPFDNPPNYSPEGSPEIELLRMARHRLEHQWTKNWEACALAAIRIAAGNPIPLRPTPLEKRVASLVARELPRWHRNCWFFLGPRMRILLYNDYMRTTNPMMLALFDRTILRLERKQFIVAGYEIR